MQGEYQPSELLSLDGSRWLSFEAGGREVAAVAVAVDAFSGSPSEIQGPPSPEGWSVSSSDSQPQDGLPPASASTAPQSDPVRSRTMRFESTAKVLAKCMLKYYRISE